MEPQEKQLRNATVGKQNRVFLFSICGFLEFFYIFYHSYKEIVYLDINMDIETHATKVKKQFAYQYKMF